MFTHVLFILSLGTGEAPDPIATFRVENHCEAVAFMLNNAFTLKDMDKKAICIDAMKFGDT